MKSQAMLHELNLISKEDLEEIADYIIDSVEELPELIEQLNNK